MTSRRDHRDDGGFSWPPTQDELDALNVLGFDDRAGAVPASYWRAPRQRRARGEPSADAPRRILPERPTIVPPIVSTADVLPPQAPRDRAMARRAVPLDHLALLASGVVIGLTLAVVVVPRPPSTTVVIPGSDARPAARGGIEPTLPVAPVPPSRPDTAVAAPAPAPPPPAPASGSGTLRGPTPTATPPSIPRRDAVPRRALVTSSAAARATAAAVVRSTNVSPDALTTDGPAADVARFEPMPANIIDVVPGAGAGLDGVPASLPASVPEPTPSATVPSTAPDVRSLIADVLLRYQAAYSSMDVGAARAVWPSVDGRALERAFSTLQEQELALGACDISIEQDHATAVCPGTLRYRPKVGNTEPQRRNGRWELQLDRGARGWVLSGVNVR